MTSKNNSSRNKGEQIFACKLCPKNVTDNDNPVLCDLCQIWVHIKCNHLNYMDYKYLQGCNKHGIASLVPIHSFYLVI